VPSICDAEAAGADALLPKPFDNRAVVQWLAGE